MMRTAVIHLLVLVTVCKAQSSSSAIGEKLGLCSRSNPDIDSCLTKRLQVLLPDIIKNGFPELDLEPSDPMYTKSTTVNLIGGTGILRMVTMNSKKYGFSKVQVKDVRTQLDDPKEFHAEVDFYVPAIFIEGDYKIDSAVGLPLHPPGKYNISMTDLSGTFNVTGEHITQNGEDYVRILKVDMFPEVGDMVVYASNLIPGSPQLNQLALNFVNRNWRSFYNVLLPPTNDAWSIDMADALNHIFLSVPFDDLLPKD